MVELRRIAVESVSERKDEERKAAGRFPGAVVVTPHHVVSHATPFLNAVSGSLR